jgi:metal-responsive CopG/Arc/MetJ family transcriptional regulator
VTILTISTEDRIIRMLDKIAIEQGSNRSAVATDILQKSFSMKPKPKIVKLNRSKQLSRRR